MFQSETTFRNRAHDLNCIECSHPLSNGGTHSPENGHFQEPAHLYGEDGGAVTENGGNGIPGGRRGSRAHGSNDIGANGGSNQNIRRFFKHTLEQLDQSRRQLALVERILRQYQGFIHRIARKFSLPGNDVEDVLQEGRIGLYKAIINYNADRGLTFEDFASLCIRNEIQAAFKRAFRQCRLPTVPLDAPETNMNELADDVELSPENRLCRKATQEEISRVVSTQLRGLERQVFLRYLDGFSPSEISRSLRLTHKQVDNAFQRAKKRLRKILASD